jgi:hypothetical protein
LPPMLSSQPPPSPPTPGHLRTNEHLAVLLPKHLWKVRNSTAYIPVMHSDHHLY